MQRIGLVPCSQVIEFARPRAVAALLLGVVVLVTGCDDGQDAHEIDQPELEWRGDVVEANIIPGRYIVQLTDQSNPMAIAALVRARPDFVYDSVISGFAGPLNQAQLNTLARHPSVLRIEPDQIVTTQGEQSNAPWGLDRIDQRELPLDGVYTYNDRTGAGVNAYVLDTGIRTTHSEFQTNGSSRARLAADFINENTNDEDCNGHGTHVAGIIAGSISGVAKLANLHSVKVLNCNGSGSLSGVIDGVNWVAKYHEKPAVANMSLGGGSSSTLDQAVNNLSASGVTVIVAGGNNSRNSCTSSPAGAEEAFTVGASTQSDAMASFSNWGRCLNIFAPGVSIVSTWKDNDNAIRTLSGTSMAAPHVAGVAALYLQENPDATPDDVKSTLETACATENAVTVNRPQTTRSLLYSLCE